MPATYSKAAHGLIINLKEALLRLRVRPIGEDFARKVNYLAKFAMRTKKGCVIVEVSPGIAIIESDVFRVEMRPRVIMWKGAEGAKVHEIYDGKRTVVYIKHKVMSGLSDPYCKEAAHEIDDYYIEARSVGLPIGDYVTLRIAGIAFVDFIVISNDTSAIVLSGKRKVFVDKQGDEVDIYIA